VEIDLRHLLRAALRWAWLIVLITLLASVVAYAIGNRQTTTYEATVQVLINPEQSTSATEFSTLQASRGQAETYRLLIQGTPVLDRVVEKLDLPYSSSALSDKITTMVLRDTQIIEITVQDPAPEQAATIANTVAEQFKVHVQELTVARFKQNLANLEQQTTQLETRRSEIDAKLSELESSPNADDSAVQRQISDLKDERTRVSQTIADVDASIRNVNRSIATAYAPVEVANPAEVPSVSSGPKTMLTTSVGVVLGLLIASAVVAGLELLDKSVRQDADVLELTGLPVVASVVTASGVSGADRVFAGASTAMDGVRMLRTNLLMAQAQQPLRTVAITGGGAGDGASTIAANLGVALAQSGHKTVIVDADVRGATLHEAFDVSNASGLTSLLTRPDQPWTQAASGTSIPGLTVLPSGPAADNAVDLLGSDRFPRLLEQIQQEADFVVIDTPAVLTASEGLAVAAACDAVVLVARRGRTRGDALHGAAMALRHGGVRVIGVVMNRAKKGAMASGVGRAGMATPPVDTGVGQSQPAHEGPTA